MTGSEFQDLTRSGVAQTFGESFAEWMDGAAPGAWAGPAMSAYGVHLVLVSDRAEAGDPPFEDVRDAARREWLHARRVAAGEALYQKLRSRYTITVEAAPAESRVARAAP
jgi:parvulin-like peptidyl-prolyl isomerase